MRELYKNILESVEREHENMVINQNSRVLIIDGLNTFIRCWTSIPTLNDNGDHVGGVTDVLRSIGYIESDKHNQLELLLHLMVVVVLKEEKNYLKVIKITNRSKSKLRINRSATMI